mgnify:CR=1 FL=1
MSSSYVSSQSPCAGPNNGLDRGAHAVLDTTTGVGPRIQRESGARGTSVAVPQPSRSHPIPSPIRPPWPLTGTGARTAATDPTGTVAVPHGLRTATATQPQLAQATPKTTATPVSHFSRLPNPARAVFITIAGAGGVRPPTTQNPDAPPRFDRAITGLAPVQWLFQAPQESLQGRSRHRSERA